HMDLREAGVTGAVRHPWEVARFRFFSEVLRRSVPSAPARIFDIGAGDAWFAGQLRAQLPAETEITCWDTEYRGTTTTEDGIRRTATKPEGRADVLLLLDVLEHVEDDRAFLTSLVRDLTSKGSSVLISVPAWSALFSAHDSFLKHYRRYSPK